MIFIGIDDQREPKMSNKLSLDSYDGRKAMICRYLIERRRLLYDGLET